MEKANHVIEIIAKWLECFGFVISIITVIKVFYLDKRVVDSESKHLYKETIGLLLKTLKTTSTNISNLNPYKSNIKGIRIEVCICHTACLRIKERANGKKIIYLDKLIKASKSIISNKMDSSKKPTWWDKIRRHKPVEEDDVYNFHETLTQLITDIEILNNDLKKSII